MIRTAGLGPAAIGPIAVSGLRDTGATVTATVTPRGSDVLVSARYGPRFEHATRAVRVGGEATGAGRDRAARADRRPRRAACA